MTARAPCGANKHTCRQRRCKTEDPLIGGTSVVPSGSGPISFEPYTDKPIYYYQIGKRIQYIHIMSNSSRNSSLSFIEIFQNRKQFQGINSIQNPRRVMITYYFLFYIQYSAWVLIKQLTYFRYKQNGKKYFPTAAAVFTGNLSTPFLK